MLASCNAVVIAPSIHLAHQLEQMAARIGFGSVSSASAAGRPGNGLPFFLLHYYLSETAMQRVITEVRGADDDDTRYAPIILITDDCPVERLLRYIELGFDDVIALPEKREVLESRIAAQLNTDQLYFQTENYLGPDRRRMELPRHRDERRIGMIPFYKLTIRRDPLHGVDIVRRQMIGQPHRPLPDPTTHFMARQFTPGAISRFPG